MDEPAPQTVRPVFLDRSGLRRYWLIALGVNLGLGLAILAALMVIGLVGGLGD